MLRVKCACVENRFALVPLLLLIALQQGCMPPAPENKYAPPPPPTVDVANPIQQKILVFLEETGQTEAKETAEVRARVTGFLEGINFTPGQKVFKPVESKDEDEKTSEDSGVGILYTIEKDKYQAAVTSAEAAVGTASAAIETAKAQVETAQAQIEIADVQVRLSEDEFERVSSLFKKGVVNQSDFDKAEAERDAAIATKKSAEKTKKAAETSVDAAIADLESAKANLAQAKLDLGYTDVKVPIDGKVTKTEVKIGNLVENGSLLATVINAEQIYANFSISDTDALKLKQAKIEEGTIEGDSIKPSYLGWAAFLKREIDADYRFEGEINYVDAKGVDAETGTLKIRAVFENPDELLVPGLFVYIRLPLTEEPQDALLLPEKTILRDQTSAYVFVVNGENKVERKDVDLGQVFDGHVVITKGLDANDQVIVSGAQRRREKEIVEIDKKKNLSPVTIPGIDSPDSDSDTPESKETESPVTSSEPSETTPTQ